MENIATRPYVYSVFITPLTYSARSVVRYILNLRGGWGVQNGSGQLRYPGGTKCFSLPLKMNKFSFHCFGSKEPTAAILSPKSFKAC